MCKFNKFFTINNPNPVPFVLRVFSSPLLKNLSNNFQYLIVTEHYPNDKNFIANKDIITGPDIRLSSNSAVDLGKDPFNLKFIERFELCRTSSFKAKGYLITEIFKLN